MRSEADQPRAALSEMLDGSAAAPGGRIVLETERLVLRELCGRDAAFVVELLNQPSFLEHIGDRGVRDLDDALRYIAEGPVASYGDHGFGLFLVEVRETGAAAGMCGMMRKPWLDAPDLAYAFLPSFWSRGYAREAAAAVLAAARAEWGVTRVVAVVAPANEPSLRLLDRLGFRFERLIVDPLGTSVRLLANEAHGSGGGVQVAAHPVATQVEPARASRRYDG